MKQITKKEVVEALKECYDPEVPINVWDLGLIYDIEITKENAVNIKMTLTSPHCPMFALIAQTVENKVKAIAGVKNCKVEVVFEPPWTPERMKPEARKGLNIN